MFKKFFKRFNKKRVFNTIDILIVYHHRSEIPSYATWSRYGRNVKFSKNKEIQYTYIQDHEITDNFKGYRTHFVLYTPLARVSKERINTIIKPMITPNIFENHALFDHPRS